MAYSILTRLDRSIIVMAVMVLLLLGFVVDRASGQELADSRLDLTGNGVVDDADAARVLDAIARLQQDGLCIIPELANRDINGDGCVDIFDAQIVLAHWGERTRPEPTVQPLIFPAAVTFTVNSNDDDSDSNAGNGSCDTGGTVTVNGNTSPECTLRAAIEESNALNGPETINFNVRNSDGSCPNLVTIIANNDLIIDADDDAGVTINGYSQCGASPNTQPIQGNADIRIQVEGVQSGAKTGFTIYSANNTIKGLAIYKSADNIYFDGNGSRYNTIQGNILGSTANLNYGSYGTGVHFKFRSSYNLVGGVAPEERNIFSGSHSDAFKLSGRDVSFNVIIGNYIGVKQDGKTKGKNNADGVDISHEARYNWLGASPPGWIAPGANSVSASDGNWPPAGASWPPAGWQFGDPTPSPDPNRNYDPRERNIISGNGRDGVEISHETETTYNYVVNNYIGVDASGTIKVGNGNNGFTLEDTTRYSFIYNNVIANNGMTGLRAYALNHYNEIVGNYIGVAPDGITPMGNGTKTTKEQRYGVYFYGGSQHNLVKNNIIANHPKDGVQLSTKYSYRNYSHETYFNTISQNSIYNNGGGEFGGHGINFHSHAPGWFPNQGILPPQISSASEILVGGTACANCIIEVFIAQINDSDDLEGGEGKTFIGQDTADAGGDFFVIVSGVNQGEKVTATATDALGNTSEFGPNVEVSDGQTPIGTVLLNGGTGLQSAYTDVLAQFIAVDNVAVTKWRYWKDSEPVPAWTTVQPGELPLERENVLSLSEGSHTVYAQYGDGEGNESVVYNATITVFNLSDPSNPLLNGSITVNNGALYTNDPGLSLQLIGPLYAKDMEIDDENPLNEGWQSYSTQSAWELENPPLQSEVVTIYAKFRDVYNNETSTIVFDDILFDPVAPTLAVSLVTETKELNLSGTQDDADGSGLGEMRFYDQAFPSHITPWLPYQTTYTWPWAGGAEIMVEVRDKAGNVTASSPQILPGPPVTIESIYLPVIVRGS